MILLSRTSFIGNGSKYLGTAHDFSFHARSTRKYPKTYLRFLFYVFFGIFPHLTLLVKWEHKDRILTIGGIKSLLLDVSDVLSLDETPIRIKGGWSESNFPGSNPSDKYT